MKGILAYLPHLVHHIVVALEGSARRFGQILIAHRHITHLDIALRAEQDIAEGLANGRNKRAILQPERLVV